MSEPDPTTDDLRPEYDFTVPGAVRGKHAQAYRQGHTVRVERADGVSEVRHFTLEEGAVLLAPDVAAVFPDAEAVNRALRLLIKLARDEVPKAG